VKGKFWVFAVEHVHENAALLTCEHRAIQCLGAVGCGWPVESSIAVPQNVPTPSATQFARFD
jgi:hypothetical protein